MEPLGTDEVENGETGIKKKSSVCVCTHVHISCFQSLQSPEVSIRSPGAVVIGYCELLDVDGELNSGPLQEQQQML